jgi:hypothetical protein
MPKVLPKSMSYEHSKSDSSCEVSATSNDSGYSSCEVSAESVLSHETTSRSGAQSSQIAPVALKRESSVRSQPSVGISKDDAQRAATGGKHTLPDRELDDHAAVVRARAEARLAAIHHKFVGDSSEYKYWIETTQADIFFAAVIVLQAILLGIETELSLNSIDGELTGSAKTVLLVLEVILTIIFCVELALRLHAKGWAYLSWRKPAHIFDAILVCFAVLDAFCALIQKDSPFDIAASLRIFRLLRLFRIARIVHICPELQLLVFGLAKTFSAAFWAIFLLFVLCYCGSLFCADLLGHSEDPDVRALFGSLPLCILTHVKMAMVEAWPDIAKPMFRQSGLWRYYVAAFVCIANLALLNVVTGVICERVITIGAELPPPSAEEQEEIINAFKRDLQGLHERRKSPKTVEGCINFLRHADVKRCLEEFGMSLPLDKRHMLLLLLESKAVTNKEIEFEAFFHVLLQLRGSQSDRLSQALQYDVLRCQRILSRGQAEVEHHVKARMHASVTESGNVLVAKASTVAGRLDKLKTALGSHEKMRAKEAAIAKLPKLSTSRADLEVLSSSLRSTLEQAGRTLEELALQREAPKQAASHRHSKLHTTQATQTSPRDGTGGLESLEPHDRAALRHAVPDDDLEDTQVPEDPKCEGRMSEAPTESECELLTARPVDIRLSPKSRAPKERSIRHHKKDMLTRSLRQAYGKSPMASPSPWLADVSGSNEHSQLPSVASAAGFTKEDRLTLPEDIRNTSRVSRAMSMPPAQWKEYCHNDMKLSRPSARSASPVRDTLQSRSLTSWGHSSDSTRMPLNWR